MHPCGFTLGSLVLFCVQTIPIGWLAMLSCLCVCMYMVPWDGLAFNLRCIHICYRDWFHLFTYIQFTLHEKAIGMKKHVDRASTEPSLGFTWNFQHMTGILFLAVINDQGLKNITSLKISHTEYASCFKVNINTTKCNFTVCILYITMEQS